MAYPARGSEGPPVERALSIGLPDEGAAGGGLVAELDDDYILLALLATGLTQIRDHPPHLRAGSDGKPHAHLPLSAAWQWGMTRLWWRCFLSGVQPPASDLDVFQWCRRPFAEWPVQLRVGEGDRWAALIEGDSLSDFAEQAVRVRTGDVEAHLVEERVFRELMLTAQANATAERSAQSLYERLRLLLIEQPILSDLQANQLLHAYPASGADEEPYFKSLLLAACERRESAGAVELDVCGGCGNLIGAGPGRSAPQCGTPGCRPSRQGLRLTTIGAYWVQRRGVRRFIHDPGLLEIRLRDELRRVGLEPELWPGFDSFDLRIRFDDGEVWGIDAKDWESAGLLARAFSWTPDPSCDRAFLVVAQHRCRGTRYLRELETELEGRVSGVEVWSEERFLARAVAERVARRRDGR